jgi:hypothetical protein
MDGGQGFHEGKQAVGEGFVAQEMAEFVAPVADVLDTPGHK